MDHERKFNRGSKGQTDFSLCYIMLLFYVATALLISVFISTMYFWLIRSFKDVISFFVRGPLPY